MSDQLPLIEAESDEALMLPREAMQKRYTATTVERIEIKRDYILEMFAWGYETATIAQKAHCSTRIVNLLGAKYSQQVAANMGDVVKVLRAKAMKAAFYAEAAMPNAKLGELGVFMGIALQRAQEAELASAGAGQPLEDAIEMQKDDPQRTAFLERLKQLQPVREVKAESEKAESGNGGEP